MLCLIDMTSNDAMTHYCIVTLLLLTLLFSPALSLSVISFLFCLSYISYYSSDHSQYLSIYYFTIFILTVACAYVVTCLI
jgi:uncharacterized protein involved in cysteine biosynthesis